MEHSIYEALSSCIKQLTDLSPDIRFRKNSSHVLISWQGNIPDAKTTKEIEKTLKQFGTPLPNHFRESNFVSFLILR